MVPSVKLQMRQAQSLAMTPQLLQSIRLLQMTNLELERFIDAEVERNPLLSRELPEKPDGLHDRGGSDAFPPAPQAQWKSLPSYGERAGAIFDPEAFSASGISLRQHVEEQIAFQIREPADRRIARELGDLLDESGYLAGDAGQIAERLAVSPEYVEAVLLRCQEFDPPGIFGRDLAECLAIQLRRRNRLDPAMSAMLANLDLLARRDFTALSRHCGVDAGDLAEMLDEIRTLDPKPGTAYSFEPASAIIHDVEVRAAPDGGWNVELNDAALPKVIVDRAYHARVAAGLRDPGERDYVAGCLQNANWLIRSLDRRARTILKVASEIVRRQDRFLADGVAQLKPLSLRMVAEAIGMHESTVSRVTANKYVATPRGVFEFRYFFSASIAATQGEEAHSALSVRHRIRELVAGEKADAVLSDDALVDILKGTGIEIARRTVAKYREAMNIPSSVQRRREKRARSAMHRQKIN